MAACAFRGGGAPARPLFSAPTHQKDQGITEGAVLMPLDSKKPAFDKSKLPSRYVSVGPESAPHRSYYYAMGMTEEEIAQPFVGVATCWTEAAPCNISLSRQAQSVHRGVKAAPRPPPAFCTSTLPHRT